MAAPDIGAIQKNIARRRRPQNLKARDLIVRRVGNGQIAASIARDVGVVGRAIQGCQKGFDIIKESGADIGGARINEGAVT